MSSRMSFVELFQDIEKYIDDPDARWKLTCRWKRGFCDTRQAGGYYKDQAYLEGVVKILRNRRSLDFLGLFCGKISLEDLQRPSIAKKLKKDEIKTPAIIKRMNEYMSALDRIAYVNQIN